MKVHTMYAVSLTQIAASITAATTNTGEDAPAPFTIGVGLGDACGETLGLGLGAVVSAVTSKP